MTQTPVVPTTTESLVARTRVVGPADLFAQLGPDGFAWLRDGVGFVAGGTAARVPVDAVADALARIDVADDVRGRGTGAIAVGHLPFVIPSDATLSIPAWVMGRTADGTHWRTDIAVEGIAVDGIAIPPRPAAAATTPGRLTRHELMDRVSWDRAVAAALDAIASDELVKVVLARAIRVDTERPIDPAWLLRRLAAREPDRFLYACAGFVGASPELLIRRAGPDITARPLAGTEPVTTEPASVERLTRSPKQRHEHEVVIAAITDTLGRWCRDVEASAPEVTELPDVSHLVTHVRATAIPETPSALGLALALHPTPAVGGEPRAAALELIRRSEPTPRGNYAGPVGWVDQHGDGEFAVALRGAQLSGTSALVHAGAGIVAGSETESEWIETTAKLEPILHALTTT